MKKIFTILAVFFLNIPNVYALEEIVEPLVEERPLRAKIFAEKIFTPKTLKLENSFLNSATVGANYRSYVDMNYDNATGDFDTLYPIMVEIAGDINFQDNKNNINFGIIPSRDVSHYDRKFISRFSNLYYKRQLGKNHSVLIGNSRTPIGLEGTTSIYKLNFIKRSQIASNFGNTRALGIRFKGDLGYVDYDIGGYSSTRFMQHPLEGAEFVGWLNYKPFYNKKSNSLQNLKGGVGIQYGRRHNNYTVLSTGLQWEKNKWYSLLEGAFAQGYNGNSYHGSHKAQGVNATLGYKITDKLQIMGRYDLFSPNTKLKNNYTNQYTAGINYYIFRERFMVMLNYVFEQKKDHNKNFIMILTQIMI